MAEDKNKYILSINGMSKSFGRNKVLKHISLNVKPGTIMGLMGENGAGKSTFIKLLYREEKATRGKVIVDGTDVSRIKNSKVPYFRRRIGVVFQNYRLLQKKTVFENVAFALEVTNTPKTEIRKKVRNVLELVGLEDKANSFPHELSGGQQQRVAIARALIAKPDIIFADEPTGNLDSKTSADVLGLLKRTSGEFNQTIVMITHNNEIAQLADRIVRIEDGKIVG